MFIIILFINNLTLCIRASIIKLLLAFHNLLKIIFMIIVHFEKLKIEAFGHYFFAHDSTINFPLLFARLFIPVMLEKVLVRLEHRIYLYMRKHKRCHHLHVELAQHVDGARHRIKAVRRPVVVAEWLNGIQAVERAFLELN